MALFPGMAIMAAALMVGFAGGSAVAHADEATRPSAPAPQTPGAQSSPDFELEPGAATPQDAREADPFGRAPGCPLHDDEAPRLLIG